MTRSTQTTRVINGEELVQRVRDTTNAFKAGRFLPLTTRPWVTNIYLMSRINYRSCALNLRQQDIQKIQSATKSWITQGYLLKPNEILLHRDPAEGGLGVVHAASRCKANLIKTFISQGDPRSQHSNSYLSTLFRTYVSQELPVDTIKKPSYFTGDFFTTIREVWGERKGELLYITTREWQRILLERGITHVQDQHGTPVLIETEQEQKAQPNR